MFLASAKSNLKSLIEKGTSVSSFLEANLSLLVKSTGAAWGIGCAVWAVLIYLLVNFLLPGRVSANDYQYIFQPILWSSLALLAWLGWRFGLRGRPRTSKRLAFTALLLALCQISIMLITGLMFGFGRSPFSRQLSAVLGNVFYLVTLLAGLEMLRAYLVVRFRQRRVWVGFILFSLFLSILRMAPFVYGQLHTLQSLIQTVGERLLPTLAQNMLATLLVMLGGPLTSFAYLGTLNLFEWLSPILPNPGWFFTAFVGTVVPAYGLVIVYNQFIARPAEQGEDKAHQGAGFTSWAVVALFTLVLIGFATGLFGFYPSLIGSGSMSPSLLVGDVVVARKVPVETIKVGDVITIRNDRTLIVHRVKEIDNFAGQITFVTQGDANNSADPPFPAANYQGKVVFTIPKIGWISIYMRNFIAAIMGK